MNKRCSPHATISWLIQQNRLVWGGFIFWLCWLCVACGENTGGADSGPPDTRSPAQFSCEETKLPDELRLSFTMEPDAPGIGPHRLVILAKHSSTNLFVELQDLQVVPWMTEHGHGAPVEPKVTRVFKGKYQVEPISFSMAGAWMLKISMTWEKQELVRCLSYKAGNFNVGGQNNPSQTILPDATPPVLQKPVVSLGGTFDPNTKRLGSLLCDLDVKQHGACLSPFALGNKDSAAPPGSLTFITAAGTTVSAATPGIVASVDFLRHSTITHSDIYRVVTHANKDAAFFVEYRNLKNVKVKAGDTVTAGQPLGDAGDHHDTKHAMVSLVVRRQQESYQRFCPERFFAPALQQQLSQVLRHLETAGLWEKGAALCQATSLLCQGKTCDTPASFVEVHGDIDAGRRMYRGGCQGCHGGKGEGGIGPDLCLGDKCTCTSCKKGHQTLSQRIALDMPPEGSCTDSCARDVAAYILQAFTNK